MKIYCPQCNGSGEGMFDGDMCGRCRGSGEVLDEDYDPYPEPQSEHPYE